MTFLRRVLSALFLGGLVVSVLRASGSGHTPLQRGGWQPLVLPPLDGPEAGDAC